MTMCNLAIPESPIITQKQEFVGAYMDRKMKNHGLPYGMAYFNLRDRTEEEAEKKFLIKYIDCAAWHPPINSDDFIIAIGEKQSNSVYHVIESIGKQVKDLRMIRYHVKVFKSDLITALRRTESQKLIPMTWYSRNKK